MSNVKPGDRAVVVKANNQANIGKIVEVVRAYNGEFLEDGRVYQFTSSGCWVVESLSGPLEVHWKWADKKELVPFTVVPDAWLRKLPDPDDVREYDAALTGLKDSQPVVESA